MKRRHALAVAMLFALPVAPPAPAAPAKPPNVIFILTDDQGWGDAHFAGHPYAKTPNLDKFAGQSTWLRQFYVAATVCSPSRVAFMTGHYPSRHLIQAHISNHDLNEARSMPDWLDPEATTLADLLKEAGYATAHFGKWHLGSGERAPPPADYGFDVSRVTVGNGPGYDEEKDKPYFWGRSTGMIVDDALKFIRENKDRPFYLNVWTLLTHARLDPTPEQLAVYKDLEPRADDPAFGPWMQKYLGDAKDLKSQMQVFCASLTDLDAQLGRLFAALDEMNLADNTIIFYSSDNGAEDYRIANANNAGVGNTGPLRARKRSMYEGGIRTFGLVRWPGHVPAGKRDEASIMGSVDFLPTVCKLTGARMPAGLKPDGEDVSDIWFGKARPRGKPLHWEWLFNVQGEDDGYVPPMLAVRDGDWKLFVNHDGSGAQLYNIPKDAGEEHDLVAAHPEIVKSLTQKALAWVKTLPPSKARDEAAATGKALDTPPKKKRPASLSDAASSKTIDRAVPFAKWDTNHDDVLTLEEYKAGLVGKPGLETRFKNFDKDGDGKLTRDEFVGP